MSVPLLGIQSEPPRPGPLVSVTENQKELDDDGCLLVAAMHLMARQATVYFCSAGVSVRERGSSRGRPDSLAFPRATRVDQVISGDGRVVAIAYSPDGPPALVPERPVAIEHVIGAGSVRGRCLIGGL